MDQKEDFIYLQFALGQWLSWQMNINEGFLPDKFAELFLETCVHKRVFGLSQHCNARVIVAGFSFYVSLLFARRCLSLLDGGFQRPKTHQ